MKSFLNNYINNYDYISENDSILDHNIAFSNYMLNKTLEKTILYSLPTIFLGYSIVKNILKDKKEKDSQKSRIKKNYEL